MGAVAVGSESSDEGVGLQGGGGVGRWSNSGSNRRLSGVAQVSRGSRSNDGPGVVAGQD